MSDHDDPHTATVFRASLQKRTCHGLLIALGFDRSPSEMVTLSTVLATALGSLSKAAKADLVQFLAEPQGAPPSTLCNICHIPGCDGYGH